MIKKKIFYSELSYLFGMLVLALGTAFMERANLGVSMVVAPAYILHLKISQFLPFFSFGMAGYTLQAFILALMMLILRRVRPSYFFSFVTAVIYGCMLDGVIALVALIPSCGIVFDIAFYLAGMLLCSAGVSLLFHTYFSPEAYDLFVKEISSHFGIAIHKFKTAYDCTSCVISIILSFAFFGMWHFEGVRIGTIICALLNGSLIGLCSKFFEKYFNFKDRLQLRKFF